MITKRAKDLVVGDVFRHHSRLKIPSELTIGHITFNRRSVMVTPSGDFANFSFRFENEQKVTVLCHLLQPTSSSMETYTDAIPKATSKSSTTTNTEHQN